MLKELTPRKIALAVHPIREVYTQLPRQAEMQKILDNPRYFTTLGLNADEEFTLYVSPKREIFSPLEIPMRERDIPLGMPGAIKRRFTTVDPTDFLEYISTAESLSITLMGGEISEMGQQGCVFGAYTDILNWFMSPGNGTQATQLSIELPFNTLFTSEVESFKYQDSLILDNFRRQFSRPDLQEFIIEEDRAVFQVKK